MIPVKITEEHVIKALEWINDNGVIPNRKSKRYHLVYEGIHYPPKYVISVANRYANGEELPPSDFDIHEAKRYLDKLGFEVIYEP